MTFTLKTKALGMAGAWLLITGLNLCILPRRYAPRVEIERLNLAPLPLIVRASGNLEAKDSNTVKSQFEGPITLKQFREGQPVQKGQLLAVISHERIRLDHQTKANDLKNAKADLLRARKDLKIERALYRKEAVAYSTVEDAERTLVKAEETLRDAQEAFNLAELQWNSAMVVAPMTGTIVKDWIGDDKNIVAGKEIVTVADVSEYTVKARVDELDIKQVHEGQPADVHLQIYSDTPLPAVVKEVGSQPEGNGLPEIPVVLALTDLKGLSLRPKLTAEARIHTGVTEPVLTVPLTAVANADGDPKVWVLGTFHRIYQTPVTLGRTNPDRVEVTQGLRPGQWVCMNAEPDYANGMKVVAAQPGAPVDARSRTHLLMRNLKKPSASDKKKPGPPGPSGTARVIRVP